MRATRVCTTPFIEPNVNQASAYEAHVDRVRLSTDEELRVSIEVALKKNRNSLTYAAQELGMPLRMLKRYGLWDPPDTPPLPQQS